MTDTHAPVTPSTRQGTTFPLMKIPGVTIVAMICFLILYAPVVTLIIYSFNASDAVAQWQGGSIRWYFAALENEAVQAATLRSLIVAGSASVIATTVATMTAIATTRSRPYHGRTGIHLLINQPMMVPEIIMAAALLIFFAAIKLATGYAGPGYLIFAHAVFCVPFAYLPIRVRLESMDATLEMAAADLYATPMQVFRRITLPQLASAIIAGAILAFVVSLDDVVITEFVKSAGQETLPTYLLARLRQEITPEVNAISTALIVLTSVLLTAVFVLTRTRANATR